MAGEHRAGTVVVRVTADTKGFRRQVEEAARGINDLDVNAVFEPDTAQLERAYREWNGKNASIQFNFKPDTKNIDPWMKRFEQQEERLRRGLSLKPDFDSSKLSRGLSEFNSRTNTALRGNGLLNSKLIEKNLDQTVKAFDAKGREIADTSFFKKSALQKTEQLSFATSLDKTVDKYREKKMDLYQQVRGLIKGNEHLSNEQIRQFEKLSNRIVKTRNSIRGLKGDLAKATREVESLDAQRLEMKAQKLPTSDLWKQEREAAKQVTAVNKALAGQEKELGRLRKAQSSLIDIASDGDAKRVSKMTRQVRALEESIVTAGNSLANFSKARDTALGRHQKQDVYSGWFKSQQVASSRFAKEIEAQRAEMARESKKARDEWTRPIDSTGVAREQFSESRREAENLIDTYRGVRKELESDASAMKRNNRNWFDLDEYKRTVKMLGEIDDRIEKLKKSPVTKATRLEGSDFQKRLADLYSRNGVRNRQDIRLRFVAENLREVKSKIEAFKRRGVDVPVTLKAELREMYRQLAYYQRLLKDNPKARVKVDVEGDFARLNRDIERFESQRVKVEFYEDGAEEIRRTMRELEHKRLDVPVTLKAEYSHVEAEMRRYAEALKVNPDAEIPAKLHIDKKHAEEELKRFQDKNDTLDMDVDLETALARAHLAYFTRPRTIDIFAKFHGTDMGKILNGMTYGATGLKGVENQFQKLVNLMDTLDSKVPKFALIGGVFTSLGAGATNLAGSVGGVGKSLISLSKAAYAAPAALTGLLGVFASFKMIYGDKGKTWSSQIDFANTKLSKLSQSVQDAFYGKAKPAIMDTANAIGDSLVPEMSTLAKHEGEIVAGMMDAVRASYKMNELPQTFDYVNESLDNLVPGVNSLIAALSKVGAAGGKYLPQFANWVSRNATLFAEWGDSVLKDSDRVDKAMSEVKEQAGYLGSSIKSLKDIFEGTFGTFAYYENGIEGMATTLANMDRAVNSVKFQQTMKYWIDGAQVAQSEVRSAFSQVGDSAYSLRNTVKVAFADAGVVVGSTLSNVSRLLGDSRTGLTEFANGLANGWKKAFDEIGNSGPAFSELLSMVGSLSNAFGGTFAASLKAAAPLIESIAEAAGSLADVFDKFPAPIKGAMGLWMTFGRAGKSAWTALKTGALENIQSTMQYQNTLRQLGVTIDGTKTKVGQLVAAMAQLSRNAKAAEISGDAAMYGNIAGLFSGSARGVEQLGEKAEKTASQVAKTDTEARLAAEGAVLFGANASQASSGLKEVSDKAEHTNGKLAKLKGVAKDTGTVMWDMAGGFTGVAGMAGVGALTVAFADYSQHAQNVEQVSQGVADAISNIATASTSAASNLGVVGSAIQKSLKTNPDAGRTAWDSSFIGKASTGSLVGDFKDASDAVNRLNKGLKTNKVSMSDMSKAVAGSDSEYRKFLKQLDAANAELNGPNVGVLESMRNGDSVRAYSDLVKRTKELRKQTEDQMRATAQENGYDKSYVDTLLKKGNTMEQVAVMTQSATQLEENHTKAEKMLSEAVSSSKSSLISMNAAGSSYNSTLASMGDVCKNVQSLMSQGQNAWDAQKQNFDLTTEAGREASNAFSTLSSNAQSYINAMIDHGDSLDEVTKKNDEMRQSIYDTAMQMFNNKDIAKALQDQYALTPEEVKTEFKAHTEQAKIDCLTYLNLLEDEFKGKEGKKQYDILINAVTHGAITDVTGVQTAVDALMGGKSNDRDLQLVLDAKDGASGKIEDAIGVAKAFGMSDEDVLLAATDKASPKINEVKKALQDKGLSDKQIQIILDALDNTKDVLAAVQVNVSKCDGKTITIDGDNKQFMDALAQATGVKPDPVTGTLTLNTDQYQFALAYAESLQIDPKTGQLKGDNNDYWEHVCEANGWKIDPKTGYITGNDDQLVGVVTDANNQLSTIKDKHVTITVDQMWNDYHNMISGSKGKKGPGSATGGRITGPGTGTSDSIPMWLSNGEHVIRAAAVDKLDRTVGPNFLNVLNATGDLDRAVSQARTSYARSAVDMSRNAYASGGRVEKLMSNAIEVNVQVPDSSRELVSAVNDLRREVAGFRDGIGGEISRNSSPWPSKRDFVRDVLEASRGR